MTDAKSTAERVGNSVWLERGVRIGLVAYGVVHLLIGWLALQLAFHDPSGAASQQGAMQELAQQPYGDVLLWAVALGLFLLAVWQLSEALVGHRKDDDPKRLAKRAVSVGRAVVYAVLGYSALGTALGEESTSSKDRLTAKLMELPLGQLIVGALGVAIIAVGVALARYAVTRSFERHLEPGATAGSSGTAVTRLGQVGYASKAIAFAVAGGLFVWAAYTYDPKKAGGLDAALHTLQGAAFGPWLLALVGLGIACFGLYCFAWARYADTAA